MGAIISYFQSLNWSNPSWDVFIFLFFLVGSLLYGLSLGRDRIIVILVSIYMALAVVSNTPILNAINFSLKINENYVMTITYFVGVFIVLFFMLSRSALLRTIGGGGSGAWWQTILYSILQVGLLISITLSFLPKEMTQGLTEVTRQVFMSDVGRSAWILLPIVVMAFAPKGGGDE